MIRVVDVRHLRTPEERAGVCYVGRAFAGWPGHPLSNPFRPINPGRRDHYEDRGEVDPAVVNCLAKYLGWLLGKGQSKLWFALASLWEECERGKKPLGCWCVDATHGDGQPVVCHAQILAELLAEQFAGKERAERT